MTLIPDLERDLVAAAERRRSPRVHARRAAVLGVAVAAATAVALVTFSPSDQDSGPKRAAGDRRSLPPAPPRWYPPIKKGTLVRLSTFEFRGVEYRVSGYRSRDGMVCIRVEQTPPAPGATDNRSSVTCSGGRNLRRSLLRQRVMNVGTGGEARLYVAGFTIPEVSRVKVVGSNWPAHVELTRPWRPGDGPRIRAFLIVIKPPRGAGVARSAHMRIRAVETGLRIPAGR